MKILNLYAGIGGNRKLWGDSHEITAVEIKPGIAETYKKFFPKDNVVVGDAHQYLLDHYDEFDFIWSSPPCPTHSNTNWFLNAQGVVRYPDMALYQEIVFLREFFKGKWVVENVIPYYEPLIKPQIAGRHCFWSNFYIGAFSKDKRITVTNCNGGKDGDAGHHRRIKEEHLKMLQKYHGFEGVTDVKLLSNCVNPKLGLFIFNQAFKGKQEVLP